MIKSFEQFNSVCESKIIQPNEIRPVIDNDVEKTFEQDFNEIKRDASLKTPGKKYIYTITCDKWWNVEEDKKCIEIHFTWDEYSEVYGLRMLAHFITPNYPEHTTYPTKDLGIQKNSLTVYIGNVEKLMEIIKKLVFDRYTFQERK